MSNKKDFFDDMMDINRDGKFDSQDMFLNQMIYNEVMKDNNNGKTYSTPKSCYTGSNPRITSSYSPTVTVILIIIAIIGWITFLGKTCSSNKKTTYSSYTPRRTYSSYSSRSYSSSGNSYSSRSTGTYNRYNSKKTTSRQSDPYKAKDYYDAEDFYYDNYDDFWDYEDAEDYYDKHCDD